MVCIYCGGKTKVGNSRSSGKTLSTWRRRQCLGCGTVFTTRERIDLENAVRVETASGRLEPFLRDKLLLSLHLSLSHRKTALSDATSLTDTIITVLAGLHTGGVLDIETLKEETRGTLARFDNAAGVYYRAHYC
jgi:transcriptional regulator NrdR family protein